MNNNNLCFEVLLQVFSLFIGFVLVMVFKRDLFTSWDFFGMIFREVFGLYLDDPDKNFIMALSS